VPSGLSVALDGTTPEAFYFANLPALQEAA